VGEKDYGLISAHRITHPSKENNVARFYYKHKKTGDVGYINYDGSATTVTEEGKHYPIVTLIKDGTRHSGKDFFEIDAALEIWKVIAEMKKDIADLRKDVQSKKFTGRY
jgi:hypothetical protein